MTISLLVDDDIEYAELLGKVLEHAGLEIALCHSGRQALLEVSKRRFDLALMDVAMPDMDGFATLYQTEKAERSAGHHAHLSYRGFG